MPKKQPLPPPDTIQLDPREWNWLADTVGLAGAVRAVAELGATQGLPEWEIARRLNLTPDEVEQYRAEAVAMIRAHPWHANGGEGRWQEVLDVMRGPQRHDPPAPPIQTHYRDPDDLTQARRAPGAARPITAFDLTHGESTWRSVSETEERRRNRKGKRVG